MLHNLLLWDDSGTSGVRGPDTLWRVPWTPLFDSLFFFHYPRSLWLKLVLIASPQLVLIGGLKFPCEVKIGNPYDFFAVVEKIESPSGLAVGPRNIFSPFGRGRDIALVYDDGITSP